MIQAVFFDIDGTLIDHENGSVVPRSTLDSLAALHRKGIKLFVATGRLPAMLGPVKKIFPFDGFVTLNGQLVLERDGAVLHRMAHRPEDIKNLVKIVKKEKFPCLIIEEQESFPVAACSEIEQHFRWAGLDIPPVYDPARLDEHPVLQFLVYGPENLPAISSLAYIEPTSAGGEIQDVIPKGGGKEVGIAAAAAHYGFSRENILVFGDGVNDERMIRWAGTGVAMGNAPDSVKAAADYVTSPVSQDGVKNALLRLGVLSPEDFA